MILDMVCGFSAANFIHSQNSEKRLSTAAKKKSQKKQSHGGGEWLGALLRRHCSRAGMGARLRSRLLGVADWLVVFTAETLKAWIREVFRLSQQLVLAFSAV